MSAAESSTGRIGPPAESGRPRLFTSPTFLVLWAAMLISSTGTFFLLLTASAYLLAELGSGLSASAVFGFQWILPVVLVGVVRRACEGARLRRTVVCCELASGALALAIGVLLDRGLVVALLLCFLVRGLLEAITKTARVVYARQLFDGPALRLASYTFNNSYYLGGALGGVLGSLLAGHVSVITAAVIDAATFAVSACCYRWLPSVSAPRAQAGHRHGIVRQVRNVLRGRRELALAAGYLVLAVGAFQGFHNAARTIVPVRVLRLDDVVVMRLQIVGGAAIFLGAVAVPVLLRWTGTGRHLGVVVNTVTAVALAAVPHASGPTSLYCYYFAFLFLFEFAFTAAQADLIQRCPPTELVALTSFTSAAGTGLLVTCTLLAGGLSDVLDFAGIAITFAAVVVCVGVTAEVLARRSASPPQGLTSAPHQAIRD